MGDPIILRLADRADAFEIATLSRELIEPGVGWCWTPPRVTHSIRCSDTIVLTARAARELVGFAIMDFDTDEAHLSLIAVRPAKQRAGVGRRLLQWLEKSARVAGIFVIHLEVRASRDGALAFYGRLGYRPIGRISGYYRGLEDAIRMSRRLPGAWPTTTRR